MGLASWECGTDEQEPKDNPEKSAHRKNGSVKRTTSIPREQKKLMKKDLTIPMFHREESDRLLQLLMHEVDCLYLSQDSDLDPYFYDRHPTDLIKTALENIIQGKNHPKL